MPQEVFRRDLRKMLRSQQRQLRQYLARAEHAKTNEAAQRDKKRLKLSIDENKVCLLQLLHS